MILKQTISALTILLVLSGSAAAAVTPVDAKGFVDVLNSGLALSPFAKNNLSLQIDSTLSVPYLVNPTLTQYGFDLKLQIRPGALENPILVREALARLYMHVAREIETSLPAMAATSEAEEVTLSQKKLAVSEQIISFLQKYEIPDVNPSDVAFEQALVYLDTQINARLGSVIAQSQLAMMESDFEVYFRTLTKDANYLAQMSESDRAKTIQDYAALKKISLPFTPAGEKVFREKSFALIKLAQKEQIRREKAFRDPVRVAARNEARLQNKLDDLLKKNDREGVARLFEVMFPWELMEPTETIAWKNWIESIRHPSEDKITMYRGLDNYDRAIKSGDATPGFFAAMINRNQGSYSDRIRSLATPMLTNRKNNLANGLGQKFYNHAIEVTASPFISFSLDLSVASMFAETGLIAVQVDRRRAIANMFSPMKSEAEILVPLIIFPDEVRSVHGMPLSDRLAEDVVKNTGVLLPTNFAELTKNGKVYSDFFRYMMDLQNQAAFRADCRQVFSH